MPEYDVVWISTPRMKEGTSSGLKRATDVMNERAAEGWTVADTTADPEGGLYVTFVRDRAA